MLQQRRQFVCMQVVQCDKNSYTLYIGENHFFGDDMKKITRQIQLFLIPLSLLLLSACGMSSNEATSANPSSALRIDQQAGVLQFVAPPAQAGLDAPINRQAIAGDFKPVTRIQNTSLPGSYFFTIYDFERAAALTTNPRWIQEGPAFWASLSSAVGLSPVHRFRNHSNGSYLYTIYEAERANIVANYAAIFAYEGVAWYAQQTQSAGWSPLYRFRNLTNGTYLFTANEAEKNNIVANYATIFALEGVAYYVWQDVSSQSDSTCGLSNFQAELLSRINTIRASGAVCGGIAYASVGSLTWDFQLQQAATVHATDMSTKDFFSHTGSDGTTLRQRLPAAGYMHRFAGENIAAGQTTVAQTMADLMASPSHCANIMRPEHRDIGMSCKTYEGSTYKNYWVMELGVRL